MMFNFFFVCVVFFNSDDVFCFEVFSVVCMCFCVLFNVFNVVFI